MATKAEKDAIKLQQEQDAIEAARVAALSPEELQAEKDAADKEAADLAEQSKAAEAALKAKQDAAKGLQKKAEDATGEQMYSKSDVQALLQEAYKQFAANQKKDVDAAADEDEDAYKIKKVRLPRFQGKFITHFKNINTDEYFKDLVITSFDVWDEKSRTNVAWVTLVFQDGSELSVPLNTAIDKSQKVWCDLIEVIAKDTSYSQGKVERVNVKDYAPSGSGQLVNLKIKQAEYIYKLQLPGDSGETVLATRDVINW